MTRQTVPGSVAAFGPGSAGPQPGDRKRAHCERSGRANPVSVEQGDGLWPYADGGRGGHHPPRLLCRLAEGILRATGCEGCIRKTPEVGARDDTPSQKRYGTSKYNRFAQCSRVPPASWGRAPRRADSAIEGSSTIPGEEHLDMRIEHVVGGNPMLHDITGCAPVALAHGPKRSRPARPGTHANRIPNRRAAPSGQHRAAAMYPYRDSTPRADSSDTPGRNVSGMDSHGVCATFSTITLA